jgi:hypothetical protein
MSVYVACDALFSFTRSSSNVRMVSQLTAILVKKLDARIHHQSRLAGLPKSKRMRLALDYRQYHDENTAPIPKEILILAGLPELNSRFMELAPAELVASTLNTHTRRMLEWLSARGVCVVTMKEKPNPRKRANPKMIAGAHTPFGRIKDLNPPKARP